MTNSPKVVHTATVALTMEDISQGVMDGKIRPDFLTRLRVHFKSDDEVLVWLSTPNSHYHGQTPWEMFYGEPARQGAYIDATCNIFCHSLHKRLPADLPALPPAPSED
jgi:hypothetical protein